MTVRTFFTQRLANRVALWQGAAPVKKFLTIALLALALPACKSKCRQLSEKLCECTANTTDRTSCLTVASSKEQNYTANEASESTCGALLDSCDCRLIDTPQGKVKCGLARPYGP